MITYAEVKDSPSGWEDLTMEDFELALSELIDSYRNKYDRQKVIEALNAQAGLLVGDDGWTESEPADEADEPEKET